MVHMHTHTYICTYIHMRVYHVLEGAQWQIMITPFLYSRYMMQIYVSNQSTPTSMDVYTALKAIEIGTFTACFLHFEQTHGSQKDCTWVPGNGSATI